MIRIDWGDIRARHPLSSVARRSGVFLPADTGDITVSCPMPNHDDTSPSMVLHLDTDRYYCFGCGAHGDVIQWIRDSQHVTAVEAARILDADRLLPPSPAATGAGIGHGRYPVASERARPDLPDLNRTSPERVGAAVEAAWAYYSSPILHRRGTDYLNCRHLEVAALEAELDQPVIGHTPARKDGLVTHLLSHGFAVNELVDAGLANHYPDGKFVDFFRQRAIVPLRDDTGRVAGLIGRTTISSHGPKYLNMSRTHTYDKSTALYRPASVALDRHANVVVCEGPLDALAVAAQAASSGMSDRYAPVAPSGLALSDIQLNGVLAIHPFPPVFCADGDTAGRQATVDWATRAALVGRESVITTWPDGHDPASWIAEHGEKGLLAVTRKGCLQRQQASLRPRHAGEIITQSALHGRHDQPDSFQHVVISAMALAAGLPGAAAVRYRQAAAEVLTAAGTESPDDDAQLLESLQTALIPSPPRRVSSPSIRPPQVATQRSIGL